MITTYGDDFATASTLFHRETTPGKIGRQMQSWARMPEGWRIVAAHVSVIDGRPVTTLGVSTSGTIAALHVRYAAGLDPTSAAAEVKLHRRIAQAAGDPVCIFISLVLDDALLKAVAAARALGAFDPQSRPLWGVPFAVKDNIDLAGAPTTCACPRVFAQAGALGSPWLERLQQAGAICIGKTNLDQFATGLVGIRSPYGVPRNPFDAAYIPGGSSSGSAVAVAAGLVAFALGTDTAGSGRVPASFNNVVGLKPTRGLVSTSGVVPACRSLDCVSIFALTVTDAASVPRRNARAWTPGGRRQIAAGAAGDFRAMGAAGILGGCFTLSVAPAGIISNFLATPTGRRSTPPQSIA